MYCPTCGVDHHAEPPPAETAADELAEVTAAEVRIAEINAQRDVQLAKIGAGIAESETVADLAHAEGVAEGQADVIETLAPEPEPEPEPVVIVDPGAGAEPEPEAEGGPPEAEPVSASPPRAANPWW